MTVTAPSPKVSSLAVEHGQIREILSRISIQRAGITWEGQPILATPGNVDLVTTLSQHLYGRTFVRSVFDRSAGSSPQVSGDLVPALSQANTGQDRWDPSWIITQVFPTGMVQVRKGEYVRFAQPGEFLTHEGPGVPPRASNLVSLWAPRESIAYQQGFYFAFGQTLLDSQTDSIDQMRFYWNVRSTGAAALLNLCTRELNRFSIPFRMKCLCRLELFDRLDAAVTYTHRRFARIAAEVLLDVGQQLGTFIGPDTPIFTAPMLPGLAYAQDPSTATTATGARPGESFGTHRCRLLAEAILTSEQEGGGTIDQRLGVVERYFAAQGISLDNPHHLSEWADPLQGFVAE